MNIVGISNPRHVGVTIATQANCCTYLPVAGSSPSPQVIDHALEAILNARPEVLIVGGWDRLYPPLLAALRTKRDFPVVCVAHGGPYHGKAFGAVQQFQDVQHCLRTGAADWLACVDPRLVRYYQSVLKRLVLFLPHAFPLRNKVEPAEVFHVGLFGNAMAHKNTEGPGQVILDYLARNPDGRLICNQGLEMGHTQLLAQMRSCSVLVHASHLEAYPNVIQEAWSMGIPVIFSTACLGLARSPLLRQEEQAQLGELMLEDHLDPYALSRALATVRREWPRLADTVYSTYYRLSRRTECYRTAVLGMLVAARYRNASISSRRSLSAFGALSDATTFLGEGDHELSTLMERMCATLGTDGRVLEAAGSQTVSDSLECFIRKGIVP